MDFSALVFFGQLGKSCPPLNALHHVAQYVSQLPQGYFQTIGYIRADNTLVFSKQSTTQLLSGLLFIVEAIIQLYNVRSVRAAHGVRYLGKAYNVKRSILMWWQQDSEQYHLFETDQAGDLLTRTVVGEDWKATKCLQFLSTTEGIDLAQGLKRVKKQTLPALSVEKQMRLA